jgi:hypothetical protein
MSEHNSTDANTDSDVKINLPYLQAPIPPTLQAKMAAVSVIFFSCFFLLLFVVAFWVSLLF